MAQTGIMLVKGPNFSYKGTVFNRYVPKGVNPKVWQYLMTNYGPESKNKRFVDATDKLSGGDVEVDGKVVKAQFRSESERAKQPDAKPFIGQFKDKAAAADWALEEHGVQLDTRFALKTLNAITVNLQSGVPIDRIKGAKKVREPLETDEPRANEVSIDVE